MSTWLWLIIHSPESALLSQSNREHQGYLRCNFKAILSFTVEIVSLNQTGSAVESSWEDEDKQSGSSS